MRERKDEKILRESTGHDLESLIEEKKLHCTHLMKGALDNC